VGHRTAVIIFGTKANAMQNMCACQLFVALQLEIKIVMIIPKQVGRDISYCRRLDYFIEDMGRK
jgi:hypothetical protein